MAPNCEMKPRGALARFDPGFCFSGVLCFRPVPPIIASTPPSLQVIPPSKSVSDGQGATPPGPVSKQPRARAKSSPTALRGLLAARQAAGGRAPQPPAVSVFIRARSRAGRERPAMLTRSTAQARRLRLPLAPLTQPPPLPPGIVTDSMFTQGPPRTAAKPLASGDPTRPRSGRVRLLLLPPAGLTGIHAKHESHSEYCFSAQLKNHTLF